MKCETVKIKADNDQGFIIINKEDKTDKQIEFGPMAGRVPVEQDDTLDEVVEEAVEEVKKTTTRKAATK